MGLKNELFVYIGGATSQNGVGGRVKRDECNEEEDPREREDLQYIDILFRDAHHIQCIS